MSHMTTAFSETIKNRSSLSSGLGICIYVSFDRWQEKGSTYPIDTESEELHGWIWIQLRNGDTQSKIVSTKTQNDVPSCVNAVYII